MPSPSCFVIGEAGLTVSCLQLLRDHDLPVRGVVSTDAAVLRWARDRDIPTLKSRKDATIAGFVEAQGVPEHCYLLSIVNYTLLKAQVCALPFAGIINYHDSLLPTYAGVHATSWALAQGETVHGISWHLVEPPPANTPATYFEGEPRPYADTGRLLLQQSVPVKPEDTAFDLNMRCTQAAQESFPALLAQLQSRDLHTAPQDFRLRTYYGMEKAADWHGVLSPEHLTTAACLRQVRALQFGASPNPISLPKLVHRGRIAYVEEAVAAAPADGAAPGTVTAYADNTLHLALKDGVVALSLTPSAGQDAPLFHEGDVVRTDPEALAALTAFGRRQAPHAAFWRRKLRTLHPLDLPAAMVGPEPAGQPRRETLDPDCRDAALFLVFLARYFMQVRGTCALMQGQVDGLETYARALPLTWTVAPDDSLDEARTRARASLDEVCAAGTYPRDLYRCMHPGASQPAFHDFAVTFDGTTHPDSAITLSVGEGVLLGAPSIGTPIWDAFTACWTAFCRQAAACAHTPLDQVPIVPSPVLETSMHVLNGPALQPAIRPSLPDLIQATCRRRGEAPAIVSEHGDDSLDYRALEALTARTAGYLHDRFHLKPGDRVGVFMERSPLGVAAMLSVLRLGCAYVPLDPKFPAQRLAYIAEDADFKLLITQRRLENDLFPHTCPLLMWEDHAQAVADTAPREIGDIPPCFDAYVLYTSGSTGNPKGVCISHGNLVNFLQSMAHQPGLTENDVLLAVITVSFDMACLEIWLPLLVGALLVPASSETAMDGRAVLGLIDRHDVTVLQATPVTWRMIAESGMDSRPHLKAICGGEPIPPELVAQIVPKVGSFWNGYGPTETTVYSTLHLLKDGKPPIFIGRPIAETFVFLRDRRGLAVPPGVPGELYIGGTGLARGYHNRPALTAQHFLPNPFGEPGSRLYRTGDLSRLGAAGYLECLGRTDNQVKIRGFRIELGEIEAVMAESEQVRSAVVVVRHDDPGNPKLAGYAIPQNPETFDAASLTAFIAARLPAYMVPTHLMVLEAFPLTPNKKIDRKALPAPAEAVGPADITPPGTETEKRVAALWAEVLGVPRVGLGSDFFKLGGHSLLVTRLQARMRTGFALDLDMNLFFVKRTVEDLAEVVDALRPHDEEPSAALEYGEIE